MGAVKEFYQDQIDFYEEHLRNQSSVEINEKCDDFIQGLMSEGYDLSTIGMVLIYISAKIVLNQMEFPDTEKLTKVKDIISIIEERK